MFVQVIAIVFIGSTLNYSRLRYEITREVLVGLVNHVKIKLIQKNSMVPVNKSLKILYTKYFLKPLSDDYSLLP